MSKMKTPLTGLYFFKKILSSVDFRKHTRYPTVYFLDSFFLHTITHTYTHLWSLSCCFVFNSQGVPCQSQRGLSQEVGEPCTGQCLAVWCVHLSGMRHYFCIVFPLLLSDSWHACVNLQEEGCEPKMLIFVSGMLSTI